MSPAPSNNQNLIQQFTKWISSNSSQLNPKTTTYIKNFLDWFSLIPSSNRNFSQENFIAYQENIEKQNIATTEKIQIIETLKQFGQFLVDNRFAKTSPTENLEIPEEEIIQKSSPIESIFDQFSHFLQREKKSKITIKHYTNDVEQFFAWLNQYEKGIDINIFTPKIIDAYRRYLQQQLNMAPASVERKVSSLRKFFTWAISEGLFLKNPFNNKEINTNVDTVVDPTNYSNNFSPNSNNKIISFLYKYQFPILLCIIILLFVLSLTRNQNPNSEIISEMLNAELQNLGKKETAPTASISNSGNPWIIHFSGQIKDKGGKAIMSNSQIVFTLYKDAKTLEPIWTSKVWNLQPDQNGNFIAKLGDINNNDKSIDSSLFFEYEELYLGTSIGGTELLPRSRISTSKSAANSIKLDNYTASDNPVENQIPIINNSGQLVLASEDATIKSNNGTFGMEGKAITISTPFDSTDDIVLSPLGGGGVEILGNNTSQNSFQVSNSQLVTGALIGAELKSNSTSAKLLSLASGLVPTTKFEVDSNGNTTIAGKLIAQEDLILSDTRTQITLSDDSNTTLPGSATNLLQALNKTYNLAKSASNSASTNTTLLVDGGSYLYPKNYESFRIFDLNATDYVDIRHDGTDLVFSSQNTTEYEFDKIVNVKDDLIVSDTLNLGSDLIVSGNIYDDGDSIISFTDNISLSDGNTISLGGASQKTYNSFANSSSTSQGLSADNDLYVEGELEIDGSFYADGLATFGGNLNISGNIYDSSDTSITINDNLVLTDSNVLSIGGASVKNYNSLSGSASSNHSLDSDNDLYIEDDFEVDGAVYFDNSIVNLSQFTSCTLTTNVSGNLVCGGAGGGFWDSSESNIYPSDLAYNVGIGFTNPTAFLHIGSTTNQDLFRIDDNGDSDISPFIVKATGNVGIGTTNPLYKLDINGTLNVGTTAYLNTIDLGINLIQDENLTGNWVFNSGNLSGISSLTAISITIGANTLDTNEWAYLDGVNQSLGTGSTVSFTSLSIGSIGLGNTGSNNSTSGAYLIGVYDELGNSNSANLQDILDDLDQAISDSSSTTYYAGSGLSLGVGNTSFNLGGVLTENMRLNIGGTEAFFINYTTGNVGIGTTSPGAKLQVAGNILIANSGSLLVNGTGDLSLGNTNQGSFLMGGDSSDSIMAALYNDLVYEWRRPGDAVTQQIEFRGTNISGTQNYFIAGGYGATANTRFYVNSYFDGNVGIGTTLPAYNLQVAGTLGVGGTATFSGLNADGSEGTAVLINGSNQLVTRELGSLAFSSTDNNTLYYAGSGLSLGTGDTSFNLGGALTENMRLNIGGTESFFIDYATGNVGIGTSAPLALFQVGNVGGGTAAFVVTSDGKVGIGTTSPTNKGLNISSIDDGAVTYAIYNTLNTNGFNVYGVYNDATVDTTSESGYGTYNKINATVGATGIGYGVYNDLDAGGTLYGVYNNIDSTATGNSIYGSYNTITTGGTSSKAYGTYNNIILTAANAQIGYADYSALRTAAADNAYGNYVIDDSGTSSGGTQYGLYVNLDDADVTNYSVFVDSGSGISYFGSNVGIGTSTPGYKLEVSGTLGVGGTATFSGLNADAGETTAVLINGSNQLVTRELGSLAFSSTDNNTLYYAGSGLSLGTGDTTFNLGGALTENMRLNIGGTESFFIDYASGNVGIGTTSPNYTLDVNGIINATAIKTPYLHTITVAKSGGDYDTITAALNSISDNDSTHTYLIKVMPGTYTESITTKAYVDISGSGENSTIISGATGTVVDASAGNSLIENVTITYSSTGTAIGIDNNGGDNFMIRNSIINITSTDNSAYAINAYNTSTNNTVDNVVFNISEGNDPSATSYAFVLQTASTLFVYNSKININSTQATSSGGRVSYTAGNATSLYYYNTDIAVNSIKGTSAIIVDSQSYLQFTSSRLVATVSNDSYNGFSFTGSTAPSGIISNSKISVTGTSSSTYTYGIFDWSTGSDVVIRDSLISSTNSSGSAAGIFTYDSNTKIYNSEVTGTGSDSGKFGRGIRLLNASPYIQNSRFTGTGNSSATGQGIYVPTGTTPTLIGNKFSGSTKDLVIDSGATINSSFNTYSSLTNAGTLNDVSSNGSGNFYVSGNIGVGTTLPSEKIDIVGDINISDDLHLTDTLYFGSKDNDTYIDYIGTDNLRLVAGGSDSLYLKSDGNVGIGTTAPLAFLNIASTANQTLLRVDDDGDNDPTPFLIDATGNVGIGTTGPSEKLEVNGNIVVGSNNLYGVGNGLTLTRQGSTIAGFSQDFAGSKQAQFFWGSGVYINSGSSNPTGETYNVPAGQLWIDGNVGIGTTGPGAKLDVAGNLSVNGGGITYIGSQNNYLHLSSPTAFYFDNGGKWYFRDLDNSNAVKIIMDSATGNITTTGNVGIGTTSPLAFLNIASTANQTLFRVDDDGDNDPTPFLIDASGNVGIGTTLPAYKLEVNGTLGVGGTATFTGLNADGSETTAVLINGSNQLVTRELGSLAFSSTDNNTLYYAGSGLTLGVGDTSFNLSGALTENMRLNIGGTESLFIDYATGNVGIGNTAPLGLLQLGNLAGGTVPFIVMPDGNVGIGITNPAYKIQLDADTYANDAGWTDTSNREVKENFTSLSNINTQPIKLGTWSGNGSTIDAIEYNSGNLVSLNDDELLNRLSLLPISRYNFINSDEQNYANPGQPVNHLGPMAQDFYKLFGLGGKDTSIKATDIAGVALAGIKALNTKLDTSYLNQQSQLLTLSSQLFTLNSNPKPILLTDTGDIIIEQEIYSGLLSNLNSSSLINLNKTIKLNGIALSNKVGVFTTIMSAGIKTSLLETKNAIIDTLLVRQVKIQDKLIVGDTDIAQKLNDLESQIEDVGIGTTNYYAEVSTTKLLTNIISPISEEDLIVILRDNEESHSSQKLSIQNENEKEVASIDNQGKAQFSNLKINLNATISGDLAVKNNATIGGELYADSARFKTLLAENIKAGKIEGLEATIGEILSATISAQTYNLNQTKNNEGLTQDDLDQKINNLIATLNLDNQKEATNSNSWTVDSSLALDSQLDTTNIDAETGVFNTYLAVLGNASIVNLEVTNNFTIDKSMQIDNNSISIVDGLDNTLYLQKSGLGKIDILAGAVTIDSSGNMTVNGDLYLKGNLYANNGQFNSLTVKEATISGSLFANIIKPEKGNVGVDLSSRQATSSSQFEIINSNKTVASIDASGSATLNKLIIANAKDATSSGVFGKPLDPTVTSNATAGTAILPKGEKSITIQNNTLTDNSLVYITPASNTYNKVLYIENKIGGTKDKPGSFTISINSTIPYEIKFNWWIIN